MAQRTDPKYICIFELELKGASFTENGVCRVPFFSGKGTHTTTADADT